MKHRQPAPVAPETPLHSRRVVLVLASCLVLGGGAATWYGLTRIDTPAAAPVPASMAAWAPADRLPAPVPVANAMSAAAHDVQPVVRQRMPPAAIRIPALGVLGRIGMSTLVDGTLTPPRDSTEVGLWAGSAALDSDSGEVTIAGHVNWAGMAPFIFGRLAYLHPGDLIYTSDLGGRQRAWRITGVYARPKSQALDRTAFRGSTGPSRLALITCGGAFDAADLSYTHNVYVFAEPQSEPTP